LLFSSGISSQGPKEERLRLLPLTGQTHGKDIANAVQKCLEDCGIHLNKIVPIATDGARSVTGIHRGATSIFQKKIKLILTFHCIIHQETLYAQTFTVKIVEVMNLVIKIINRILAKALYHRPNIMLYAQTFTVKIVEVMNLVIKIINRILAKALYHRQFKDFFEEIGSPYSDLLLHNKVRWLSRGNVETFCFGLERNKNIFQ